MLIKAKVALRVWWRFFIRSFTIAKMVYEQINTKIFLGDVGVFKITVSVDTMAPDPNVELRQIKEWDYLTISAN